MVEHASFIITHCQVGSDGKTPYERHKGKRANFELCAFGEQVYYMPLKGHADAGKKGPRYHDGVWLGISEMNGETFVGTPEGVKRSRSILRRPDKWIKDKVEGIWGMPWCLDGEDAEGEPEVVFEEQHPGPEIRDEELPEPVPRRLRISRQDLVEHGYTAGCPGCTAQRDGHAHCGGAHRPHSELYRNRLIEALHGTEEGRKRIGDAINRIYDHVGRLGPDDAPREWLDQNAGGEVMSDDP